MLFTNTVIWRVRFYLSEKRYLNSGTKEASLSQYTKILMYISVLQYSESSCTKFNQSERKEVRDGFLTMLLFPDWSPTVRSLIKDPLLNLLLCRLQHIKKQQVRKKEITLTNNSTNYNFQLMHIWKILRLIATLTILVYGKPLICLYFCRKLELWSTFSQLLFTVLPVWK